MRKRQIDRIARALGANRIVFLGKSDHTPFGMLALTDRVRKLRSTGPKGTGRPSNPVATVPRIVKFRSWTWTMLGRVAADQARRTGRQVSPAQIASMLIEEVLAPKTRRQRHVR